MGESASNNERESPDIFHEYYKKLSPVEIRHDGGEKIFDIPQHARASRRVCRKLFIDSESDENDAAIVAAAAAAAPAATSVGYGDDGESGERRRWRLQRQKHQQEVWRRL